MLVSSPSNRIFSCCTNSVKANITLLNEFCVLLHLVKPKSFYPTSHFQRLPIARRSVVRGTAQKPQLGDVHFFADAKNQQKANTVFRLKLCFEYAETVIIFLAFLANRGKKKRK